MFDDQPTNSPSAPANLPQEPKDMFEDVDSGGAGGVSGQQPVVPANALAAGLLKKRAESELGLSTSESVSRSAAEIPTPVTYATKAPVLGKIFMGLGTVVLIGVAGYIGLLGYNKFFKSSKAPAAPAATTTNNNLPTVAKPADGVPDNIVQAPASTNATSSVTGVVVTTSPTGEAGADIKNKSILFGDQIDTDKDGVPDALELKYGTDPKNPDTDGDGLTDGDEIMVWGTDPLKKDTDGDGLSDYDEVKIWHTNPLNPDTDGDGFSDGLEVSRGYNPLGPGKLVKTSTSTPATSTAK